MKLKKERALDILTELGSESNAHGLAKIATATHVSKKFVWVLLVIGGFVAASLQLSSLIGKYMDFPFVEVSKMIDGLDVQFPAITICNIAPISLTKTKERLMTENSELRKWLTFIGKNNFGPQTDRVYTLQSLFENLEDEAQYLGRDLEDFLIHCQFNQEPCSVQNFTKHFDGHYFNCYTFNNGDRGSKRLLTHSTGPQNGLSLILSLDNDDPPVGSYGTYNMKSNIEYSAGARVVVHPPNTMPSPVDHGFDVPPGYSSSVGLRKKLHARLPEPYGKCESGYLKDSPTYGHTLFSCLEICKQRIMMDNCGCRSSHFPRLAQDNYTYCGLIENHVDWRDMLEHPERYNITQINLTRLACEEKILSEFKEARHFEQTCNCYQPCHEATYQKSLSLSYWPLEFNQLDALQVFYKDKINETFLYDAYKMLKYLASLGHQHAEPTPPPTTTPLPAYTTPKTVASITSIPLTRTTSTDIPEDGYVEQLEEEMNPTKTEKEEKVKKDEQRLSATDKEKQVRASNMIRQNLLRLNVYLEDLSITEFRQTPAYEFTDLLADFGGTLGLWMGISVLTVMELVELLCRLSIVLIKSRGEKKPSDSNVVIKRVVDFDSDIIRDSESPI